jgi:hypothetical protein
VLVGGKFVQSFWDSCSSHVLISSRLAAELILEGHRWRRDVYLPMKQGVIWAGAITTRIWADLDVVHQGRHISVKDCQFYVWDMGRDITLSCAFMDAYHLQEWKGHPTDDERLRKLATAAASWTSHESGKVTSPSQVSLAEVESTRVHILGQREGNGFGQGTGKFNGVVASVAAPLREGGLEAVGNAPAQTNRHDSWTREKAEALRDKLRDQMRTPIPELQRKLEAVAETMPEAFGEDIAEPCLLKAFKIRLKTGAKYVAMVPRRLSAPMLDEVKKQVAALLAQGVIRESDSPWAFPLVLVRRPGSDKVRCCVDFRLLNSMTEPYPYGMQDLHQTLDDLAGKKYYWSVDVSSYYHQIKLEEESCQYTAFVLPGGSKYEYTRVPFGLRSAPAWAQQQLREALQRNQGTQKLINFLDDITYGSDDIDDSVKTFQELLKFCVANKIKLKRSKCTLGVGAVKALGFVVNEQGKWIDPDRVLSLLKIPKASTPKELKQLLGSFGFVRQFLVDSAKVCDPLFDLLKKHAKFSWTREHDAALEKLKECVVTAPCLGQIDPSKVVYARVDASDIGVGCVLYQMVKDKESEKELPKAIAYASRRFSPAERRWALCEREGYSTKFVWEKFQSLLQGLPVVIETDHRNHLYLHSAQSMKLQRWRMYLQQFTYEIRHVDGNRNCTADGMSRIFEHLSSLHIANLMATAPTDEQAKRERQEGIIAPSTTVVGGGSVQGLPEAYHCDEGPDGPEGEGGSDEALFAGLWADSGVRFPLLQDGVDSAHANFARFCAQEAGADVDFDQMVEQQAEGAVFEDVDLEGPPVERGDAGVEWVLKQQVLDAKLQAVYGLGFKLLEKMGWAPGAAVGRTCGVRNEAIDGAAGGREVGDTRGLGRVDTDCVRCRKDSRHEILVTKIRQVHNAAAGHVGALRTYRRLRMLPGFPWGHGTTEVQDKVNQWCKGCLLCNKVWRLRGEPERAQAAVIRQRPFTEVAMDLIVLTEPDRDGNKNILVVIDSFSRAVELFPLKTGDAESVVECLYDCYNRWGRPMRVRCDGAKAFLGSVCRLFNRKMGVKVHSIEPYSPQQNGQVERANQEVMRHLRAIVLGEESGVNSQFRWGMLTPAVRRIMNNTVNWETGVTPNDLLYGGYADTELLLFQDHPAVGEGMSVPGWVFARELEEAQWEALRRSELHQEKVLESVIKAAVDKGVREVHEGEWVLVRRGGMGQRPKTKLQSRYMGPYLVVDREDPTSSIISCQHLATKVVSKFHLSEVQVVDLSHYREVTDAIPVALRDEWTYLIDSIVGHRPAGNRKMASGRLRAKQSYSFLVKYALLPESTEVGEENPCWQPWCNCQHLTALRDYCAREDVRRELGDNFYVSDHEE